MSLRFRLLQARTETDPVREEERTSFARHLGVSLSQVEAFDLLGGATSFDRITHDVDAILVGGSGDHSVLDDAFWLPAFFDTLAALAEHNFPTFASCFGFQGLVIALGGEVIHDAEHAEVGSFELETLPAASDDPIFSTLPKRFWAQEGHKDRASRLPENVTAFVQSERAPFQALRVNDTMVYATQFHPELDDEENRARFMRYHEAYQQALGHRRASEILDAFHPSPESNQLLATFAKVVAQHR